MRFIQRLGYYLGGFAIGLIILAFFLSGKKTSCAYFPEARVLKNIGNKPYTLSAPAQEVYTALKLDSLDIRNIWDTGDVSFRESDTQQKPCGSYKVYGTTRKGKALQLQVDNCEDTSIIQSIKVQ